jgi:hypothetical protein
MDAEHWFSAGSGSLAIYVVGVSAKFTPDALSFVFTQSHW